MQLMVTVQVPIVLLLILFPVAASLYDVIIVGGGLSGLMAAWRLKEAGISFLLLESHSELGGRVKTERFNGSTSHPINLGPMSITRGHGNHDPAMTLAKQYNISTQKMDHDSVAVYNDGEGPKGSFCETDDKACTPRYEEIGKDMEKVRKNIIGKDPTQSRSLRASLYDMGWFSGDSALKRAYEWYNVDYKHAASAADLSASHMTPKAFEKGSTEELVTSDEGIQKLIAEIAREIDQDVKGNNCGTSKTLKCFSKVTRILSKRGNPTVTFQHILSGKLSNVSAKYVLITVSLGVLKRGQIEFDPPLSAEKQNAIQKFGMGNLTRIFAQFDDSFWNLKPLFLGRKKPVQNVIVASYDSSYFNAHVNLAAYNSSWRTLVLSATGVQSSVIERKTNSENTDDVNKMLSHMYEDDINGKKLVNFRVAKWETDPHFYGSRSYWPAGFKEVDHEYLRSTERGRIFFAGEATSKDFFGFLQGAICTGLDQADAIIKLLPYDQNGAESLFLDNLKNGCNNKHVIWWHVWWHSAVVALGLLVVSAAFIGTIYGIKRCRRQNGNNNDMNDRDDMDNVNRENRENRENNLA